MEEEEKTRISGKSETAPDIDLYEKQEVVERFWKISQTFPLDSPEAREHKDNEEEEEKDVLQGADHGKELWGIGYVSSDHEPDFDDEEDEEDDMESYKIREKILKGEHFDFDMEEFEIIANSTILS